MPRPRPPRRYGDAGAPFAIAVGGSVFWHKDVGYDAVTSDDASTAFELYGTYDIWTPVRGVIVAAGLSYRAADLGVDQDLKIWGNALQAEFMARYGAATWLWPHLRVGVGVGSTHVEIRDRLGDLSYADNVTSAVATFGGGITLRTPTRLFETWRGRLSSLSLGLSFEGGYFYAKDGAFAAKPTGTSEIARTAFTLGKLERSAPYLRVTGVVRF